MAKKAKKSRKSGRKAAPRRHGRTITVTLARLSQGYEDLVIPTRGTLADALVQAGYARADVKTMMPSTKVNGKAATLKLILRDGDFIAVAPRVQGGSC